MPDRSETANLTVADRRGEAAIAAHRGDEATVRRFLNDEDAPVRATAFSGLVRLGNVSNEDLQRALRDPDPIVRRTACEHGAALPGANFAALLDDPEAMVVETACFAVGEIGDKEAIGRLCIIATSHDDPLCRESAVAALGAIGEEEGRAVIIAALEDIPAIRRRAVIALSAFEGEEVKEALRAHADDRDWQVRQAVEDILNEPEQ